MSSILLLNGPNLNLLGEREPDIYGDFSLEDIEKTIEKIGKKNNIDNECFQSNAEHELVDKIHNAKSNEVKIILFNPGAFTHSSISLRDAILGVNIPLIEIHLSNIYGREEFREKSYFSDIALGVVSGFGKQSYLMAFQAAKNYLLRED
jgi:3-dehydroquinate dehydratase-2